MTLIVSLNIPDGIVIAGDSLSTIVTQNQPSTPVATFSYTQKVLPFRGKFGIGTFGSGLILGKSVYFAMRWLEQNLDPNGVTEAANQIGHAIHQLLNQHLQHENTSVDALPPDQFPLGFQIVGYDGLEPKMIKVFVGQKVQFNVFAQLGCVYSGSGEIVETIWGLYKTHPENQPPYHAFSLQDAIDYADFLISTTIAHQRFSQRIPNVGGDIDIALVTPFDGFRWICQKAIGKILEEK